MIVDHEGGALPCYEAKQTGCAVNDSQLIAEVDLLADFDKMRLENVTHPHHVHQFGAFVHNPSFFAHKDNVSTLKSTQIPSKSNI